MNVHAIWQRIVNYQGRLMFTGLSLVAVLMTVGCDRSPEASANGATILVSVVDMYPQSTPIPGVKVTLTPGDVICISDENGECRYEVEPGSYYIDA